MAKKEAVPAAEEHLFTIPMRNSFIKTERARKTNRAIRVIKAFVSKSLKADTVKISQKVNDSVWKGGDMNPPGKIRVKVKHSADGVASVMLPEEKSITLDEEKKKILEEVEKEKAEMATGKKEEAEEKKKNPKAEEKPAKAPDEEKKAEEPKK